MVQQSVMKRSSRILINAIRKKDINAIVNLVKYGTDMVATDYDGNSPVHHALFADNAKILELLLKNGAEVDISNNARLRPYNIALELKDFEYIEILLKYKARIDIDDFDWLLQECPKKIVNLFYENVDVNDVSFFGYTALHYSVKHNDLNGVRTLLLNGADINKPSVYEGYMPLHLAKSAKCVELLLQNGAKPNIKDKYACTPLYTIALSEKFSSKNKKKRLEQRRMIKILFENGADGIDVIYAGQIDLDYGRDWNSMDGLRDILKYMALTEDEQQHIKKMDLEYNDTKSESTYFYRKCLQEVMALKADVIFSNVTAYGFVTRSVKELSYYACNRKVLNLFNERKRQYEIQFPIYYAILEQQFNDAMERLNLLDVASSSLSGIVKRIDTYHIVTQRILELLTTDDMHNLIIACQPSAT